MTEKVYLVKALEDLGYPYEEGGAVSGYRGSKTTAEIKVSTGNSGYDIGFQKTAAGYEVVADWYGIRNFSQAAFVEQVNQRYAYNLTCAKLEEQGFALVNEAKEQDGRIHLTVRRVV